MAMPRLKRQYFYTCLCCAVLILAQICACHLAGATHISLYGLFETVGLAASGASNIAVRGRADLLGRHIVSSLAVMAAMAVITGGFTQAIAVCCLGNAVYALWLAVSKVWIRHMIGPAWTVLVYDNAENLEKARKAVSKRPDLAQESYHFGYGGDTEGLDHMLDVFRIGQVVICMDDREGTDRLIAHCRGAGVVSIVPDGERLLYTVPGKIYGALKI